MKDPWVARATVLLLGGLSGAYFPQAGSFWAMGILGLLGVPLIFWKPRDFFGHVFRPEILLLAASLMLGFVYGSLADRVLLEPLSLDRVEIVGTIQDWSMADDRMVGLLCVEEGDLKGQTYRLSVYPDKLGQFSGEWQRIQQGDLVSFLAQVERPKAVGTPGGFDQRLYYAVRGLSGTIKAQGDVVLLLEGRSSLSWRIRQQVRAQLQAWDSEETGVLEGIFFGDSSRIPDAIQERYKVTGVLHVFAASGSNVAFVLALSWMILFFMGKRLRIVGTVLILILYAELCGGNAPILRATILGVAVLIGRLGRGQVDTLRWLLFSAVALFIQNSLIIKDLGFQLSFTAAWGMVVIVPYLLDSSFFKRIPNLLRFPLAGTIAAQVATLPLLVSEFHRLSLIGLVANVFILFILGSVLEVGLIGVVLSFSGGLAVPFFQVSLWLLSGTNEILKWLARVPYADVWVVNPGFLFWLLWYGGLVAFLCGSERALFIIKSRIKYHSRWIRSHSGKLIKYCPSGLYIVLQHFSQNSLKRRWQRKRLWSRGIVVLLVLLCLLSPWNMKRNLEVVMIDVGQGDSLLIRTPKNQAVLIDAGPRNDQFDAGERIVLPYLLETGTRHLEAVLITHEHQDHIGGVRAVLNNIPTDWVGVPAVGDRLDNEEWVAGLPLDLSNQLDELKPLQAGDRIELDSGAWLDILGPQKVMEGTHSDPNNNSLVIKLNYLGQSVLLTGDMEEEEIEEIATTGVDLENTLFKEPHHGSRFSLDKPWLDRINPEAVLISVGKNTYGHPSEEVLQYWQERQIPVYRTDEHGTVRFIISEKGVDIVLGRI